MPCLSRGTPRVRNVWIGHYLNSGGLPSQWDTRRNRSADAAPNLVGKLEGPIHDCPSNTSSCSVPLGGLGLVQPAASAAGKGHHRPLPRFIGVECFGDPFTGRHGDLHWITADSDLPPSRPRACCSAHLKTDVRLIEVRLPVLEEGLKMPLLQGLVSCQE